MPKSSKKALLEFFLTDTTLYTFIIRPDLPELSIKDKEPIVLKSDVNKKQVEEIVQKIRADYHEINKSNVKDFSGYLLDDFFFLGVRIFTPKLYKYIKDFDVLYLVPFGSLHYLPLHAFKINGQYLIDLFQISYLPSASVLQYLKTKQSKNSIKSILLAGVDHTGDKHHFMQETDQISKLPIWDKDVVIYLKDDNCTKPNFFEDCSNKSIIHLSTHGEFNPNDPLLSGALLYGEYIGEDLETYSKFKENQEFILSAKDIFERTNLDADLVVMSGCVTGDSENKPGDELIGLTRALIYAGAKTMIVSLFPTFKQVTSNNADTSIRFAAFYDLWFTRKLSKGDAFQQYISNIKQNEKYQHPYYWFQFIMVGNVE